MKSISRKILVAVSFILLVFSCFVFVFLYKKVDNNRKTSEQLQFEYQTEETHRSEIKSLDNTIKAVNSEKMQLESHFASGSDVVPFLNTIEKSASDIGLKAEVYTVDVLKDNNGLSVGIKVSGNFQAIYNLLMLLENSSYELEFLSFNLQRNTGPMDESIETSKTYTWNADLKVKLLSFIP